VTSGPRNGAVLAASKYTLEGKPIGALGEYAAARPRPAQTIGSRGSLSPGRLQGAGL